MKFPEFPGLENEILNFHDFPGFPWPVRILEQVTDNLAFTFSWTKCHIHVDIKLILTFTSYRPKYEC